MSETCSFSGGVSVLEKGWILHVEIAEGLREVIGKAVIERRAIAADFNNLVINLGTCSIKD